MTTTRSKKKSTSGPVSIVGSGPGDAALLTMRAVEALSAAELVLHDKGVATAVLALIPEGVEQAVADVDDKGRAVDAADIAKAVVEAAKEGRSVVRLVSGDPVVDGALAAEGPTLAKAKLTFEVVPAVPSVSAVAGYSGIPLVGGKSSAVHVVDVDDAVDWSTLTAASTTLVLRSAGTKLESIAAALLAAGRSERTPVAVVLNGTTTDQRTVVGTLDHVGDMLKPVAEVPELADALVVIGDAVSARERLSWFETKPLFGWRVLVPRTKEQAGALSARLERYGATSVEVPTISVEPPRTPQQMERAIQGLVNGRYQWVAFTSANAVRAVREKFEEFGLDARSFSGLKVAAIGEATAAALRAFGVNPDLVPSGEQSSAGLVADWPAYDELLDPINRVFLPRADIATETLVEGLVNLGWEVDDVTAYRTVRAAPPAAEIREAIKSGGFDAVLFTSASTVRNLIGIAGKPHASTVVACIGPATAEAAAEHGLRVDVQAPTASVAALAEALADFGAAARDEAAVNGDPTWRPSQKRAAKRKTK